MIGPLTQLVMTIIQKKLLPKMIAELTGNAIILSSQISQVDCMPLPRIDCLPKT